MRRLFSLPGALDAAVVIYLCFFLLYSTEFTMLVSVVCVAAIRALGRYFFVQGRSFTNYGKIMIESIMLLASMLYLLKAPVEYQSYRLTVLGVYVFSLIIFENISILARVIVERHRAG